MYKANNILTTKTAPVILKGLDNKPKGALQVLYTIGWIDPEADHKEYTIKGQLD